MRPRAACALGHAWRPRPPNLPPTAVGRRAFPTAPATQVNLESLRARQPKELLRNDAFRMVPPEDVAPQDLAELASSKVLTDPAKILDVYHQHVKGGEEPDPAVLVRAFTQLGFLFDPNSFFSTADRQTLTAHERFRSLAHDLARARATLPAAAAPLLLYAMSCLEYRCAPLLPTLLDHVEQQLSSWRCEVLSLLLHSLASLGLGGAKPGEQVAFGLQDGGTSRDYGHLLPLVAEELGRRLEGGAQGTVQDWARASFALVMAGEYDVQTPGGPLLPRLVELACEAVKGPEELDGSGWAQFFLYQTLYCVDVEKPAVEEAVKRAMPMWLQERLHQRWLDGIVLYAQPQGADKMQQDVDAALRRSRTQALLNCSAGRAWDEQHCWFAGFLLHPQIALECDSLLPLAPGRPRPSGWLTLKARVLRQMGYKVVTIHSCFWRALSEDQKDEQLMTLRAEVGYEHSPDLERRQQPVRQTAYRREEPLETKQKTWQPLPEEEVSAAAPA